MTRKLFIKLSVILFLIYHLPFIWIANIHVSSVGWDFVAENWFVYPMGWLIGVCTFIMYHGLAYMFVISDEDINMRYKDFWIEQLTSRRFKKHKDNNNMSICMVKGPVKISIEPRFKDGSVNILWKDINVWIKHSEIKTIYGWNSRKEEYRQVLPYKTAMGLISYNEKTTLEAFDALADLKKFPLYIQNPIIKKFIKPFMEIA